MKKRIILPLLLSAIMVLFLSCSKDVGSDPDPIDPSASTIYMRGSVFSVPNLTIATGLKVTWVNDDNMIHTVTANDASFSSGDINPGGSFSLTFNTVGVRNYFCAHHAGMTGVVTVVSR